ncbi:MAG: NUMOD4 domain-containing protein [Patescibacteria group bacterium]
MKKKNEKWENVPGYEGRYLISDHGRLFSIDFGIVKLQKDRDGYQIYRLSRPGSEETRKIHRLVLSAFIGVSNKQVNHKNGRKADNRLCNLEYCTDAENKEHAVSLGLHAHGERAGGARLTAADIRYIRREYAKGHTLQKDLSKQFGVLRQCIGKIVNRQRWAHVGRPR